MEMHSVLKKERLWTLEVSILSKVTEVTERKRRAFLSCAKSGDMLNPPKNKNYLKYTSLLKCPARTAQ
jgi:hypothetical protein